MVKIILEYQGILSWEVLGREKGGKRDWWFSWTEIKVKRDLSEEAAFELSSEDEKQ